MKIPKELTTITTSSKTIALGMFIFIPIIAFFFGMRYQVMFEQINSKLPLPTIIRPTVTPISCTLEVKLCSDGTTVGRVPPTCEFGVCPNTPKDDIFCGGIAGKTCPSGYYCKYDGSYPDASGTCIKEKTTIEYTCPKNEYVDCMPGPDRTQKEECTSNFLQWAKLNCPNFKGAAF